MRKRTKVYVPPDLLRTATVWAARTGRKDHEIFEEALKHYLGLEVIESVWARSDLSEILALDLAYEELHASRS